MYNLTVMPISMFSGLQELIFMMCKAVSFMQTRVKDPLNYSFGDKISENKKLLILTNYNTQRLQLS